MFEPGRKFSFFQGLGRNVIILGAASLLTDVSSQMLYPVIPLFLTGVLHAPMSVVGLIEGIAESTASLLKVFSGWYSDRLRRRTPFAIVGYAVSAVGKPILFLAGSWPLVLLARVVDRVGKGLRAAPRDAMLAASCDPAHRGKAFGLHKAMDTVGAAIGPVIAVLVMAVMGASERTYRLLFLLAIIPAVLGVLTLTFLAREAPHAPARTREDDCPGPAISPDLKKFLVVLGIFAVGNSSNAFLLLKAQQAGFSAPFVILSYAFYNLVHSLMAMPVGLLSDRLGRKKVMMAGFVMFSAVYFGFAFTPAPWMLWVLFGLYGFYSAATEGIWKAYIADLSTPTNRGTAMGLMQTVTGILAFVASAVAGILWTRLGPWAPFLYGAACSLLAGILFATLFRRRRPVPTP
jgi:MFS family permease